MIPHTRVSSEWGLNAPGLEQVDSNVLTYSFQEAPTYLPYFFRVKSKCRPGNKLLGPRYFSFRFVPVTSVCGKNLAGHSTPPLSVHHPVSRIAMFQARQLLLRSTAGRLKQYSFSRSGVRRIMTTSNFSEEQLVVRSAIQKICARFPRYSLG